MKCNSQMEQLYQEIRGDNLDDPRALPQKLIALLNAGFVEEEECVFFSQLKPSAPVKNVDFPDKTGYECFVNHLDIEDYLENGGSPALELLGRGLALAQEIKERLSQLHGTRHFRVIVAFTGPSCSVRFHTVRQDEGWTDKDLCRDEAIAIFETQEQEI